MSTHQEVRGLDEFVALPFSSRQTYYLGTDRDGRSTAVFVPHAHDGVVTLLRLCSSQVWDEYMRLRGDHRTVEWLVAASDG